MKKNFNNLKGLTLIELLVAISISLLVGIAVINFGRDIFYQNYLVSKSLVSENEAKSTLSRIVTELRRAVPAGTGAYPLDTVSSTTLIFYSDTNGDGVSERLHYWRDGLSLKRGLTSPSGSPYTYSPTDGSVGIAVNTLINATGTIFSYYDQNYDGSSSPLSLPVNVASVRLIKIDLGNLSNQVMLRVLKDNY
ncbi:MAG: prepilin-type N-terminal cleavage/methylation domain-containing protein [Candidatus Paceibacterota bacterium]